jgi:PST family polysaccharide transporter
MANNIIDKFRRVLKLDIVKVFSFTSVSTLVKMIAGFISVKVVAVIIGPSGVALVGQLNNFSAIIISIATGGISVGVTKYIAQYKDDIKLIKIYISTAVKITLFFSFFCGLFLVLASSLLSTKVLLDNKYGFVFIIFGITLIFYSCNTLLLAVINGYKQFNLYVRISIISSLVGLFISLVLVVPLGISGSMINVVTSQSFVFLITLFICKKTKIVFLTKDYIWNRFDKIKAIQYLNFSFMTLVSAFCAPISQLIIRGYIINKFSMQSAGWWEGINRLSGMYLMIVTSSFGVYYLPKLSELINPVEVKQEIKAAYKVIIPCLVVGLTCVYFGRFLLIKILFSPEFYSMADLFLWQVIGDFLKIASWLIAFIMHAKAMTRFFVITELIFTGVYMSLSLILSNVIGLQGIVLGYAINYFTYFCFVFLFIYCRLEKTGK